MTHNGYGTDENGDDNEHENENEDIEADIDDDDVDADDDNESTGEPNRKRAKRNSKTPHDNPAKPTQLKFYRGGWVDVLELAKKFFRHHIAIKCAFPDRETEFRSATDCLTEAIKQWEDDGGEVEEGKCRLSS